MMTQLLLQSHHPSVLPSQPLFGSSFALSGLNIKSNFPIMEELYHPVPMVTVGASSGLGGTDVKYGGCMVLKRGGKFIMAVGPRDAIGDNVGCHPSRKTIL
eukprot:1470715-Ditylum_brightwellii.AAC.1